jgi:hypothetical protein
MFARGMITEEENNRGREEISAAFLRRAPAALRRSSLRASPRRITLRAAAALCQRAIHNGGRDKGHSKGGNKGQNTENCAPLQWLRHASPI